MRPSDKRKAAVLSPFICLSVLLDVVQKNNTRLQSCRNAIVGS